MTVRTSPIIPAKYASNAETTEYTAPSGTRTIIDKMTAYSASGCTVTVKLVPSSGTASAANIIETKTLQAGETYGFPFIVGHSLEPGGFISIIASSASAAVIRASGREVS